MRQLSKWTYCTGRATFVTLPGEGDLDMIKFTRAVMATGYSGPISLEIFNDQFRGGRPKSIAKDGYRSLVALMDDVNRAEPALALDVPDTPDGSRHGVSPSSNLPAGQKKQMH